MKKREKCITPSLLLFKSIRKLSLARFIRKKKIGVFETVYYTSNI